MAATTWGFLSKNAMMGSVSEEGSPNPGFEIETLQRGASMVDQPRLGRKLQVTCRLASGEYKPRVPHRAETWAPHFRMKGKSAIVDMTKPMRRGGMQ